MSELLELARNNDPRLEGAFEQASADPSRREELFEALGCLATGNRPDTAEMLAWSWLSEVRAGCPAPEALDLARRLLLLCPGSAQLRDDLVELYRAAFSERADIGDWLAAAGLTGAKVSPQRACRAVDLALVLRAGDKLVERTIRPSANLHEHPVAEIVSWDSRTGSVTIRPVGGAEQRLELLRLADDYEPARPDDFRVLAKCDPQQLKALFGDDPLGVLVSMLRAAGGRMDSEQIEASLTPRLMSRSEYDGWWPRARAAARKSPHVRLEGRSPVVLTYDPVGTSPEQETLAALDKTREPGERLAVVESYLRQRKSDRPESDAEFLTEIAGRVCQWALGPDGGLGDALLARRLADLGLPIAPETAGRALELLTSAPGIVDQVRALEDPALWSIALDLLPQARPIHTDRPAADDWQAIFIQLLPSAPPQRADDIAAVLIEAGQVNRLNAEIIAIVESPVESINGLCWLWLGPARADDLSLPRPGELLDQLLWLAGQAQGIAAADQKLARGIRAKVRAALSAKNYARFRAYVQSLEAALAPLLRRQIRRADGLGVIIPEQMTAILDEHHPPTAEARPAVPPWQREDVILVSPAALAAKESELECIVNVEMPANARAIGKAASYGDLSENSEFKFALEERDLLRARVARIQQELSMARVITAQEVPTDHVSIYSTVELAGDAPGDAATIRIVSPWDSDAAQRRFNYRAPISQQLLGKRPGDAVRLALDGGPERDWKIVSIRRPEK